MKVNLTGFGLQRRLPPFLTLPSPRGENELLCEGARFPSLRPNVALTSGRDVDAVEPICSA
jgi:hypothetical protein|tara:strand:+ start:683 stop:865 length:183 start_codon:yes stop_codon:yes gene_type:complete